MRERRILAQQLTQAIENDELEVFYQAQASIATGEIIGFEALARWNHPVHGYVAPAQFIPIAEETDLILHLGEWILRKVCKEAANWTQPYTVAVNLSPIQFKLANLPELVHQILLETGMPPAGWSWRSPRARYRGPAAHARHAAADQGARRGDRHGRFRHRLLLALHAAGVPFDKLKIDKSFVDKIGSRRAGGGDRDRGARPRPQPRYPGARRGRGERRAAIVPRREAARRRRATSSAGRRRFRHPAPGLATSPPKLAGALDRAPLDPPVEVRRQRRAGCAALHREPPPARHLVTEPRALALCVAPRFVFTVVDRRGERHPRR